jgi:predicted nucleotidyltransferase
MQIGPIEISERAFSALCAKWMLGDVYVFGSVLRNDFHAESDVDLLVDFVPEANWSLMDLVRAEQEFAELFARKVQIVERSGLLKSQNHIRREAILSSARLVRAA